MGACWGLHPPVWGLPCPNLGPSVPSHPFGPHSPPSTHFCGCQVASTSLSGQLHFISKAQEEGDAPPKEGAPEKFEVSGFRERGSW